MLIEEYGCESAEDIQEALKDLLESPLGLNTRNGSSSKKVRSSNGEIDIDISRDRDSTSEPQALKKYQKDISNIENQIISMYAKGLTTRAISSHIK